MDLLAQFRFPQWPQLQSPCLTGAPPGPVAPPTPFGLGLPHLLHRVLLEKFTFKQLGSSHSQSPSLRGLCPGRGLPGGGGGGGVTPPGGPPAARGGPGGGGGAGSAAPAAAAATPPTGERARGPEAYILGLRTLFGVYYSKGELKPPRKIGRCSKTAALSPRSNASAYRQLRRHLNLKCIQVYYSIKFKNNLREAVAAVDELGHTRRKPARAAGGRCPCQCTTNKHLSFNKSAKIQLENLLTGMPLRVWGALWGPPSACGSASSGGQQAPEALLVS